MSHWHAQPSGDVLEALGTSGDGLDTNEVARRTERYGRNTLPVSRGRGPLQRFLLQFHNVLIYVLILAALATTLLGHWVDTGVIVAVIVINALIGFIQEGKAERALDAIRNMLSHEAIVRRDGHRRTVPAEHLVPGDIVILQSGDRVAADLRLLEVKDLRVDEAVLTGESIPTEKSTKPVPDEAVVGDRTCMAFSSTFVTYGHAVGVVVNTGAKTEIGKINRMLSDVQELTTPLLKQIAGFGRALTVAILALGAATFAAGYLLRDYAFGETFLAVVGIAVAAIPEGLPAIITITLAIGVQRMAARHAIIRRLPAVETLGSITVICSDKTGTLTRNEMMVRALVTPARRYQATGTGYGPDGEVTAGRVSQGESTGPTGSLTSAFEADGTDGTPCNVDSDAVLHQVARACLLCNDASVKRAENGEWLLDGDPTEGALIAFALKAGLSQDDLMRHFRRQDVIPFESEHRFMATLDRDHAHNAFVFVKGAPERILGMCERQISNDGEDPLDTDHWHEAFQTLAAEGQRLIALAFRPAQPDENELAFDDVQQGLTLLGVVGIMDPPREEAIAAVQECHAGGIRVKMITGDHPLTAVSIARHIGIGDGRSVLTGAELDDMNDAQLAQRVPDVDVFARTSPEHKLRLVRALQAHGEVVAMTGDGVNDAPALKQSNVGVAMGIKGTEVSKQAAQMVLADDNFASITAAIREGRTVYDNIKKALLFILPTNGGQAFTIVAAILLGMTLPITPVQILWVNMVTAVTLALALAFEPMERGVMQRPPRPTRLPLLSRFAIWRIGFVSTLLVAITLGFFVYESRDSSIELARSMAVNALVTAQVFYLVNSRFILTSSLHWRAVTGSRYVPLAIGVIIVLQMAFTYAPPMQLLFGTEGLSLSAWGKLILAGAAVFLLVELEKFVVRRYSGSPDRI